MPYKELFTSNNNYDSLLDTLPMKSNLPTIDNKNRSSYNRKCYKVSNNRYPNCPALMDDGRAFTDYRAPCFRNDMLKIQNNITNSYDYRQFLINNGEKIINNIRVFNLDKLSCRPCDATPIDCNTVCKVSPSSVNCMLTNKCGLGRCNMAVPLDATNSV